MATDALRDGGLWHLCLIEMCHSPDTGFIGHIEADVETCLFPSSLYPSVLWGRKKNALVLFYVCSAPGGVSSITKLLRCCKVWQGASKGFLNFTWAFLANSGAQHGIPCSLVLKVTASYSLIYMASEILILSYFGGTFHMLLFCFQWQNSQDLQNLIDGLQKANT